MTNRNKKFMDAMVLLSAIALASGCEAPTTSTDATASTTSQDTTLAAPLASDPAAADPQAAAPSSQPSVEPSSAAPSSSPSPTASPTQAPSPSPSPSASISPSPSPSPSPSASPHVIHQVSVAGNHSCAVVDDQAYCWGDDVSGLLGDGGTADRTTAFHVPGLSGVTQIESGDTEVCALANGDVYCWGNYQASTQKTSPTIVAGLPSHQVASIAHGQSHACALIQNGDMYCWGYDALSAVGDGAHNIQTPPVMTPYKVLSGVTQISAGGQVTCASKGASIYCWGQATAQVFPSGLPAGCTGYTIGQTLESVTTPCLIQSVGAAPVSPNHTCINVNGGQVECKGTNSHGQLGNGTTTDSAGYVFVSFPF